MDTEDEDQKRKARAAVNEGISPSVQRMYRPPGTPDPDYVDIRQRVDDDPSRRENAELVSERERQHEDKHRQQSSAEVTRLAQENAKMLAAQAGLLEEIKSRNDALGQEVEKRYDGFEKDGGKFAHEKGRYKEALGNDNGDPYDAMRRAAGSEFALFLKEQEAYEKKIDNEDDLTKRRQLTMQKDIRAAEHLAFTSERIADQAEVITETRNNDVTERFEGRAAEQERVAKELREDYSRYYTHKDPKFPQKDWEKEERETYERGQASARQESEKRAQYEASSIGKAFDASSAEITDTKAEKLAQLQERWDAAAGEVTASRIADGPARPANTGGMSH